uniref:Tubulin polyglutamylase ttll6 n=1 Tax=Macrostomum lignano TaxID=282301 RepID=A0A1I8HL04_9PLAT
MTSLRQTAIGIERKLDENDNALSASSSSNDEDFDEDFEENADSELVAAEATELTLEDDPTCDLLVSQGFLRGVYDYDEGDDNEEEEEEELGDDYGEEDGDEAAGSFRLVRQAKPSVSQRAEERGAELRPAISTLPELPPATGGATDSASRSLGVPVSMATPNQTSSQNQQPLVRKKKKKKKSYEICLTNCKYEVVQKAAQKFGLKEVEEDDEWNVLWTDTYVSMDRACSMKKYQKINHFPGMSEICRKDCLGRNLARMRKLFPKEYNFAPRTWVLPADYGDFQAYARANKKHRTYIVKPDAGCQGKGIWFTRNPKDIKPGDNQVCQLYVSKPLLIDGYKFDLRIYVLVTSCDPLKIFVFKEGLARFTTVKYKDPTAGNLENVFMHLTNYAVQKNRKDFVRNDEEGGTKRHNYRSCFPNHVKGSACFEILGFDILLDRKLRPIVLEVNHSPSFTTDSRLDKEIKEALIWDTLHLINIGAVDKKKAIEDEKRKVRERLFQRSNKKEAREELEREAARFAEAQERYENDHLGNYRRIYPLSTPAATDRYERFFTQAASLYQETAATKARADCARQQREEIEKKLQLLKGPQRGGGGGGGGGSGMRQLPVRPESPDSDAAMQTQRRQRQRQRQGLSNSRQQQRRSQQQQQRQRMSRRTGASPSGPEPVLDTSQPVPIVDEEEIQRLSGLLQRDSLVRGMGVVELVYRMLHCTAGTMALIPTSYPVTLPGNGIHGNGPNATNNQTTRSSYNDELSASKFGAGMVTTGNFQHSQRSGSNQSLRQSQFGGYPAVLASNATVPPLLPASQRPSYLQQQQQQQHAPELPIPLSAGRAR